MAAALPHPLSIETACWHTHAGFALAPLCDPFMKIFCVSQTVINRFELRSFESLIRFLFYFDPNFRGCFLCSGFSPIQLVPFHCAVRQRKHFMFFLFFQIHDLPLHAILKLHSGGPVQSWCGTSPNHAVLLKLAVEWTLQGLTVSSGHSGGATPSRSWFTHVWICVRECVCVSQSVATHCNARVCVLKVLALSTALVMLRQTVSGCVYFWVSDSVSMAADASERKALRYKQTLVSLLPLSSSSSSSASVHFFFFFFHLSCCSIRSPRPPCCIVCLARYLAWRTCASYLPRRVRPIVTSRALRVCRHRTTTCQLADV